MKEESKRELPANAKAPEKTPEDGPQLEAGLMPKDSQMESAKYAAMADELAAIHKAAELKESGLPSTSAMRGGAEALAGKFLKQVPKKVKVKKPSKLYRGGSSAYPV